jgi:hypothetical protein
MASKNTKEKRGRLVAVPRHPDTVKLTFSSGFSVLLEPPSYATYKLIREREAALFPEPEIPVSIIETAGGDQAIPALASSQEGMRFMLEMEVVGRQRAAWRHEYLLRHHVTVLDGEGQEAEQDTLLQQYTRELARLEALRGESFADADEQWLAFVANVVLKSREDYQMLNNQAARYFDPVSDEEVAVAADSFRGAVQRATTDGGPAPGVEAGSDANSV